MSEDAHETPHMNIPVRFPGMHERMQQQIEQSFADGGLMMARVLSEVIRINDNEHPDVLTAIYKAVHNVKHGPKCEHDERIGREILRAWREAK